MEKGKVLTRIDSLVGYISNLIILIIALILISICTCDTNCSYNLPEFWFVAYSDNYNSSVTICLILFSIENFLTVLAYASTESCKTPSNHCLVMKTYEIGLIVFPIFMSLKLPTGNTDSKFEENFIQYFFYLINIFLISWAYFTLKYQKTPNIIKASQIWILLKLHFWSLLFYLFFVTFAYQLGISKEVYSFGKPLIEWSIIFICVKVPHSLSQKFPCYLGIVGHLNKD